MTTMQTKSFDQVVQAQAAAVQGGATRVLADFSVGSILRAVIEATAAVVMWLQGLIVQLLTVTRASTSTGADLDSWMADYGLTRLPAVAATGTVTFARFTPTLQAVVPVGSLVQTADGTQQYAVVADVSKAAYNSAMNAYVLPAATASITATVTAVVAGSAGNTLAGTITALGQAISGVDTVTNASAFANGADQESDAAFRTRFIAYIGSLAKATKSAVNYAVSSTAQGLTDKIVELYDYSGAYKPGTFYAVIDDGTGSPPSGTITIASNAIDAVRACGIQFAAYAPVTVAANVAVTVGVATGYDGPTVRTAVQTAITAYINSLNIGDTLVWSRLYQVAYDASAGVTSLTGLTINSGTANLTATVQQVIIAGTVTVS